MAVTLCYFTEFGKPVFQYITASICGGMYAWVYFVLRVWCRCKESSRSLSPLLMSFLYIVPTLMLLFKILQSFSSFVSVAKMLLLYIWQVSLENCSETWSKLSWALRWMKSPVCWYSIAFWRTLSMWLPYALVSLCFVAVSVHCLTDILTVS